VPDFCPNCGGHRITPFGVGTERVEEEAARLLPDAVVARLDRDAVRVKGALEDIMARFRSGEIHVLVGTQMVAKGLDFPNVTLVGVVAADVSLSVPDFRATERTFQLLSQVSGRAGRGRKPGRVIIQTLSPEEPAVVMAQTHDYEAFFRSLSEERALSGYPPFRRLVRVLFTGEELAAVEDSSSIAAERLRRSLVGAEVVGPASCPLERLNKLHRRHLLVKLDPGADPAPVARALEGIENPHVRLVIDVDPMSLT
jgi:primosomal protein N' (replication factor Y)